MIKIHPETTTSHASVELTYFDNLVGATCSTRIGIVKGNVAVHLTEGIFNGAQIDELCEALQLAKKLSNLSIEIADPAD